MADDIDKIVDLMHDDIDQILSEDDDEVVPQTLPPVAGAPLFLPLLEALGAVLEKGASLGAEISEYMEIDDELFLSQLAKQIFESNIRDDLEELTEILEGIDNQWDKIVHTIQEFADISRPNER